jgi:hypothetical protein
MLLASFAEPENSSKRALGVTRQDSIKVLSKSRLSLNEVTGRFAIKVAERTARCNLFTMVRLATCLLLASVATLAAAQSSVLPRLLGKFPVKHPAFVQLFATEAAGVDPLDKFTLYVSNFDALAILEVI